MNDKTPIKQIQISAQREWILLDDGHTVSYKVYQKILKHAIKETERKTLYKIQETKYYVMRGEIPE